MKKCKRKFWAGLLSMGLMMACVLSVSAATATVQHIHTVDFTDPKIPVSTEITYLPGNHTTIQYKAIKCSCGEWVRTVVSSVTESHNMEYSDAGHMSGGRHKYIAQCNYCGYSTTILIDCPGHTSP